MKRMMMVVVLAVAGIAAACALGQDISKIPMSGVLNMLKMPIAVGEAPQAPFVVARPTFENIPTNECRVLQVTDIIFDPVTRRVRGAVGGSVYPSTKETLFVLTNEVRNAVNEASGNSATFVPLRLKETCCEELYWWTPPGSKGSLELIVRAHRIGADQFFVGCCLHTKGDDIGVKFAELLKEKRK